MSDYTMTAEEMNRAADELDALQAVENEGRGISCVRSIINYLRKGQEENAVCIRQIEGDKTRSYPKVEAALYRLLGCRLHCKCDCDDWLCQVSRCE